MMVFSLKVRLVLQSAVVVRAQSGGSHLPGATEVFAANQCVFRGA